MNQLVNKINLSLSLSMVKRAWLEIIFLDTLIYEKIFNEKASDIKTDT
jgi:hypothetical protein